MKKRLFNIALVFLLCFCFVSFQGCGSDSNSSSTSDTWGELENPKSNATLSETIKIKGWCFSNKNVTRVEIWVDALKVGNAIYGLARTDITTQYSEQINQAVQSGSLVATSEQISESKIGFEYSLDTKKYSNGKHSIAIKLITNDSEFILSKMDIIINNTSPATPTPTSTPTSTPTFTPTPIPTPTITWVPIPTAAATSTPMPTPTPIAALDITKTINCVQNNTFILTMDASNIRDFNGKIIEITYNTKELEPLDLCALTQKLDIVLGYVSDTSINIVSFDTDMGKIVFTINKVIPKGKMWNGVINSIKFKAKINGTSNVTYKIK